ncbi:SbcC/MukB-like Walker B domain-containing protein [Dactylosporangium sp. NPDC051485]|uniref:SbcC/MukB-like Walker B domain-containing protein n=1 Tax=Dactylosporangium sp. NPDC051485 TaxID=3154846 RepID=UPI00343185C3
MTVLPQQLKQSPGMTTSADEPDPAVLGVPAAVGRWQPTRAGAVNSWAWADETLLFADGWLALAGPNGSGKSLTASMLVTLLLDANWAPKALSVSGEAAGTLADRHTNRNPREDRTGAWWLEYGRRAADSSTVEYLTTGVWLRSAGGDLHRAFFVVPARVGVELSLQADRDPVSIEDLAAQLATHGGRLFTDSQRLSRAAGHHLTVGKEDGYRSEVRTALFAPLDEVQFEALLGVLRSLRSVRTAEAISPNEMRRVLTEALPALDPVRLAVIAEAMERISDLESQLNRSREEVRLLERAEQAYRRYVTTVTQTEAASLIAADTGLDGQTRKTRKADTDLATATAAVQTANVRRGELREEFTKLEGQLAAADAELRKHAGADLPHLERRLNDLQGLHQREADRAAKLRQTADRTTGKNAAATQFAQAAQRHLADLTTQLQAAGTRIGADAVLDQLLQAATVLAEADSDTDTDQVNTAQLASTPIGWTEMRGEQIQLVEGALHVHVEAQGEQLAAAAELRRVEDEQESREDSHALAVTARQGTEQQLRADVSRWEQGRIELPELPTALVDDAERVEVDQLVLWLTSAAQTTSRRIDVVGRQQAVAVATAGEKTAAAALQKATAAQNTAEAEAEAAAEALQRAEVAAAEELAAAQADRTDAAAAHEQAVAAAQQVTTTAREELEAATADATRTAAAWAAEVAAWRTGLVQLSADAVPLPGNPDLIDLPAVALAVERAHAAADTNLRLRIPAADRLVEDANTTVDALMNELTDAEREAPVPAAPPWRPSRADLNAAPLWSLVDFQPHVTAEQANRIEGALLVSGLLDALVDQDGTAAAGDLTITAERPASGRSLADVLMVEADPAVPADRLMSLLRAVSIDDLGGDIASGLLQVDALTALAPPDYEAAFIGRTARERARLARVATLQADLDQARAALDAARQARADLDADLATANAERDRFPPTADLRTARERAAECRLGLSTAERQTSEQIAGAELALARRLADITTAETAATARLREAQRIADDKAAVAVGCREAREQTDDEHATALHVLASTTAELEQAEAAQQQAEREQAAFPDLDSVRTAQRDEDLAAHDVALARVALQEATTRHGTATSEVQRALRKLNTAATLPDGMMLPTAAAPLRTLRTAVTELGQDLRTWQNAAGRTIDLLRQWHDASETADTAADDAAAAEGDAEKARLAAAKLQAQVEQMRQLHGADYELLRTTRARLERLQTANRDEDEQVLASRQEASNDAARAQTVLDELAPQRLEAERHRDHCLRRLGLLITHSLAAVPQDLPTDEDGRPAHITAAITWSRRILTEETGTDRLAALIDARTRALSNLEATIRAANQALARFDQQVDITTLDGTDWRRVTLAATNAAVGEDLLQAVANLRAVTGRLEDDLRGDVKATLKTSMFTELRRDIQSRRELAQELVRQIRATLAGVRTGVERVGVEVDWAIRQDPDAKRMIELLTAPPSDETFNQMYEVLRKRMDDASTEAWADRVAHTFDYRSWHEWNISITHRSFSTDSAEVFRPVNARSNPLKSLSTGESRLATMLPLLAAAWSMYAGDDYDGPHLLSIDEIDAAFDEPNLRQIFALLRSWNFDVLATTPTMTPMIKREVQQVVVHQLITTGRNRVTVPWLWRGRGAPEPLTFDFSPAANPDPQAG